MSCSADLRKTAVHLPKSLARKSSSSCKGQLRPITDQTQTLTSAVERKRAIRQILNSRTLIWYMRSAQKFDISWQTSPGANASAPFLRKITRMP